MNYTHLYISKSHCPYENLALENELLENIAKGENYLFIYLNKPSLIYGRFQNPWVECNLNLAKTESVKLVRRQSGGGCVYHDLGNINFSFITATRDLNKEKNNRFLLSFLKESFGIEAYLNKRSDLRVRYKDNDYKISGCAFKQKKDRSLHHCTLLVSSNLNNLNKYLNSSYKAINSKGIDSNPSPVINLSHIDSKISKELLLSNIKHYLSSSVYKEVSLDDLKNDKYFERIISWNEIYGQTPYFEHKMTINEFEVHLKIKKALILDCYITSRPENNELDMIKGMKLEKLDMILNDFIDSKEKLSFKVLSKLKDDLFL